MRSSRCPAIFRPAACATASSRVVPGRWTALRAQAAEASESALLRLRGAEPLPALRKFPAFDDFSSAGPSQR